MLRILFSLIALCSNIILGIVLFSTEMAAICGCLMSSVCPSSPLPFHLHHWVLWTCSNYLRFRFTFKTFVNITYLLGQSRKVRVQLNKLLVSGTQLLTLMTKSGSSLTVRNLNFELAVFELIKFIQYFSI